MYVHGLFYLFFVRVPIGSCLQILDGLFSLKEAKIFDNCMLHQTPERVFHPISKHTEVGVWKLHETHFCLLMQLLKLQIILGESQSICSPNFVIIFQTPPHGFVFSSWNGNGFENISYKTHTYLTVSCSKWQITLQQTISDW